MEIKDFWEKYTFWVVDEDFSVLHIKPGMLVRHPNRDVVQLVGFVTLELKKELQVKTQLWESQWCVKALGDGCDPQEQEEPCAFLNQQAGELKSLSRCFDLIWKHLGEEIRLTRWSGSLLLLFSC